MTLRKRSRPGWPTDYWRRRITPRPTFWSGESVRTLLLKRNSIRALQLSQRQCHTLDFQRSQGILDRLFCALPGDPLQHQPGQKGDAPKSVFDLIDPQWKGKVTISDPRFGTMSFHAAALFIVLGDEKATRFIQDLRQNEVRVSPSNSDVRRLVENGEMALGLTDTDDANTSILSGKPVGFVYPDEQGMEPPSCPTWFHSLLVDLIRKMARG